MSTGTVARRTPTWIVVAIAAAAGLFYAYIVWSSVDLLIRQATGALGLSGLGWFVHLLPVVFPMVAFGVAFALGSRRPPGPFALILLTGLALSAAFWLNIVSYAVTSYGLYGG
ncbi:bacitracin resistance protein [Microbacterium sp. CJ88]|uniref:bacitracin resistance protein n=1 Tax=Microbacterium sp. CJ88 TaxID=3445672 RepID=UPI003F65EDCA